MKHYSRYHINCEFDYQGERFIAWLCPYYELTDQEMELYNITEYNYVVHLFSPQGFRTFEMFPDEALRWVTNASPSFVDDYIIDVLGYVLVNAL
jgi:hypothetical protein